MENYFPIFMNMQGARVQVFGGGTIAARRVSVLLEFGAKVWVAAPEISEKLEELAQWNFNLALEYRPYQPGELQEAEIVIAATSDSAVNDMICRECNHKGILVNVVSDREKCDFYFPGIAREGEITVGVTAGGRDHQKAAEVTKEIRRLLKEIMPV